MQTRSIPSKWRGLRGLVVLAVVDLLAELLRLVDEGVHPFRDRAAALVDLVREDGRGGTRRILHLCLLLACAAT